MIKFTDVCKAYIRYWFIILICIVLALSVVLVVVPHGDSYTAISTLSVEKKDGSAEQISSSYADNIINQFLVVAYNTQFVNSIISEMKKKEPEFAEHMTIDSVKTNMKIDYKKNSTFFTVYFTGNDKNSVKKVVETIDNLAIDEFKDRHGDNCQLVKLSAIDIIAKQNKLVIYSVIGILIGLVLGVVLVTFFVVFNPFVENKDLLSKETDSDILADINKKNPNASINNLATNIELIMTDAGKKFLAFTTDSNTFDVVPLVNTIAMKYIANHKVAIVSYEEVSQKVDKVDYIVLGSKKEDVDSINELTKDADLVLVVCPNIIDSKYYLRVANYTDDAIIVAKKWSSKTAQINTIKGVLTEKNMNVLGIVYQN